MVSQAHGHVSFLITKRQETEPPMKIFFNINLWLTHMNIGCEKTIGYMVQGFEPKISWSRVTANNHWAMAPTQTTLFLQTG